MAGAPADILSTWVTSMVSGDGNADRDEPTMPPAPTAAPSVADRGAAALHEAQVALNALVNLEVIPQNIDEDFEKARAADRSLAEQHCRFGRCVKKTLDEEGKLVSVDPSGSGASHSTRNSGSMAATWQCGCCSAQVECVAVFALQFLLALPQVLDNWRRNSLREACRAAWRVNGTMDAGCAYEGVDVRPSPPPRSLYLMATLGACEEFSNATQLDQPTLGEANPFVRVEAAEDCLGGASGMETLSWWLSAFGGTCVFLIFLLRLLRLQTGIVRSHDQQLWTVSDYAVLIEGLEEGKEVDAQEATLRADLERVAGIREEDISHIEIGCGCRREQRLLEKIARLRVVLQELHVRCQLDATRQARLEAVKAELKAARTALEALRGDETGTLRRGRLCRVPTREDAQRSDPPLRA